MKAEVYQKLAHEFADYSGVREGKWTYPVMGLAEEAGEVAGKFAKAIRDDGEIITPERKEAVIKELGDVLWMVAEIATQLDVSLAYIMASNIEKLESRKRRNVIHGEGDNR